MAALRLAFAAAALCCSSVAAAAPGGRWAADIARASRRFGIPEEWIKQVMRIESGGRVLPEGRPIVSRAGAMGLMQLMPGTWNDMRIALGLGPDPFQPTDNILAGAFYLRLMYDRFGYPGLFAAYNAGPGRYAAYLGGRQPLPAETRAYVGALARMAARSAPAAPPRSRLFALAPGAMPVAQPRPGRSRPESLFIALDSGASPRARAGGEAAGAQDGRQEQDDGTEKPVAPGHRAGGT